MTQRSAEFGQFTRVTTAGTIVTVLSSAPLSLIGIGVAAVLTSQIVQLWSGNATGTPIIGTSTLVANSFTRFPCELPAGLTYVVTNEDIDLTLYWIPSGDG